MTLETILQGNNFHLAGAVLMKQKKMRIYEHLMRVPSHCATLHYHSQTYLQLVTQSPAFMKTFHTFILFDKSR